MAVSLPLLMIGVFVVSYVIVRRWKMRRAAPGRPPKIKEPLEQKDE